MPSIAEIKVHEDGTVWVRVEMPKIKGDETNSVTLWTPDEIAVHDLNTLKAFAEYQSHRAVTEYLAFVRGGLLNHET